MRILYGIQTTGNGHLSRSSEMVRHLKDQGHDVHVLFSGAGQGSIWDMNVFDPFTRLKGLTFVTKDGKIDQLGTAMKLDLRSAYADIRNFKDGDFDVVLTDFEPLSARIAKKFGITSIGVSHQCAFHYDVPKARFNYSGKFVTKIFAPVDINIGLHWHHFNQPVMPPIVDVRMDPKQCRVEPGKILVYLPFENRDQVRDAFHAFPDYRFHVYEKREAREENKNIVWEPFSRKNFQSDLLSCDGVICQSGFELPSEAIHLGKKLLVKPVYGQYEQLSNAMVVDQYGLGKSIRDISADNLRQWFQLSHPVPANYPDVAKGIAQWVGSHDWTKPRELATQLWSHTHSETQNKVSAHAA